MLELTSYISVFIIGLSYGSTACMFSCMPFLTPLLFSSSNSTKEALGVILPFSFGRVFSYTILSIIAYLSSFWLKKVLDDMTVSNFLLGFATIFMGFYIFYKSYSKKNSCKSKIELLKRSGKVSFFTMGATMSLNPCAPVMALLGFSINAKALHIALFEGLFFGLGAVMFSILFYGFVFSKLVRGLLAQFLPYKVWVERASAVFLIILGIAVFNNQIKF